MRHHHHLIFAQSSRDDALLRILFHYHQMIMNFLLDHRILFLVIAVLKLFTEASSLGDNDVPPTARRRVYFGSMDALFMHTSSHSRSRGIVEDDMYSVSNVVRRNTRRKVAEDNDEDEEESRGNKLWPPWPFNLLTERGSEKNNNGRVDIYKRNSISLFWSYFSQRMLITKRQLQHGKKSVSVVLSPRVQECLVSASIHPASHSFNIML